jgi:SAM-dependent methyltransferase
VDRLLRATANAEARHFWFRGFRFFVTPFLHRATQNLSAARILDCGCGTGANLELLRAFGQPFGLDLNETGLRYGMAAGRRRLVRASADAVPFPDAAFDVVTSFDVLYGLPEVVEKAAVSEMFRVLRPGGHIVVNVAALDILRGDHSVLGREVRRYTRSSLGALLADHGFTIVRITYTNAVLFLPMLAVRAWQRQRGLRPEAEALRDISVPAAPVNSILTAALLAESWWLRAVNSPIGSSVLCLARKPA